jgi:UDP-glucuronate 4-epimerase
MRILVTGAAGFIGAHVARRLSDDGHAVTGIDNLNAYYDPALKRDRLARFGAGWAFREMDCKDRAVEHLIREGRFDRVVHLAAQAGVRWSLDHPYAYADANLQGFLTVLEGCRHGGVGHLVYASSSSVYGNRSDAPFRTTDPVDHPVSLYAASKRANELMAHTYSHLFALPTTGLRFFTVYGPWGRPDMAYWTFTAKVLAGEPIPVFNHGRLRRDFTWIDDIVEGVVRCLEVVPTADPARPAAPDQGPAPFRIHNIGNHDPVELESFIAAIEDACGRRAVRDYRPMQPGDVLCTAADCTALREATGFAPRTPLVDGIRRFVAWYRERHGV